MTFLPFPPSGLPVVSTPSTGSGSDSSGRQRVSEPKVILHSKQTFDGQPLLWSDAEVSGSGTTATYTSDRSGTVLAVGATTAGRRLRQSTNRINYVSGLSQRLMMGVVFDESGGGAGITRCTGLYDDDNGMFVRDSEGTLQVVLRSSVTGSVVDDPIDQSSWNLDTMDGSGESGITLNLAAYHVVVFDFLWLGAGAVRIGFLIEGEVVYCHEFTDHSNVDGSPFMSSPNLPMRYEIENDGTGVASEMFHGCTSVLHEGREPAVGLTRLVQNTNVSLTGVSGTRWMVLAARLGSGANMRSVVDLVNVSLGLRTNDTAVWSLVVNPTIAGSPTFNAQAFSAVEIAQGASANTATGGIEIMGGLFTDTAGVSAAIDSELNLGAGADGTPSVVALCVTTLSGNLTVDATAVYSEQT